MWRPWSKSSGRAPISNPNNNNNTFSNFAFSSFKDIEAICSEDRPESKTPIFLRRLPSICHRVRTANSILRAWSTPESLLHDSISQISHSPKKTQHVAESTAKSNPPFSLPAGAESRIVVYYTSLRVVRPTFEACKAVLAILQAFRVPMDERDLSMDLSFLTELKRILKDQTLTLPRVFIGGRYVGGAEEVRQLHECGELKKLVSGLPRVEAGVCESCGGFRFVLCGECSGSRKIYNEKGGGGGGFRSCTGCNENGLVRCPVCSFQSPSLVSTAL